MPHYAQLTGWVVTAVTQTSGPISGPGIIEISSLADIIGCTYNPATGEFVQSQPGPVIPQSVTAFQAKAALLQAGLLDDVEALMASPDTPRIVKLAWVEALMFERQSPTVQSLGSALGLDDAALDALFVTGSGITA